MTIHRDHPFAEPEGGRDPVRRLRGRLGGQVSLWTAGAGRGRVGLTVSSVLAEPGDPGFVIGLIDPESSLADHLRGPGEPRAVVSLLEWRHRDLAEQFAGLMPAPGGPFAAASWLDTGAGPRLADAPSWARVVVADVREIGWRLAVTCWVEAAEVGVEDDPLVHRRGRYLRLGSQP